jgi:hypothetical protein
MTPMQQELSVTIQGSRHSHARSRGVILADRFTLIHFKMKRSEGLVCQGVVFVGTEVPFQTGENLSQWTLSIVNLCVGYHGPLGPWVVLS